MQTLRKIFIPISLMYGVIVFIRNKLYDHGIFKSYKVSKPVISVGNITTGGTGKTPLTIFLAKHFLERGKLVGVVSRGYKRKTDKMVLVCDGYTVNEDIEQSGDELILISTELIKDFKGKFSAAAGTDKIKTSNFLINKFNPDIIILDDGFQSRKIKRDFNIAIIDAADYLKNSFLNSFVLPSGNLRESFCGLERADFIIQNNKADELNIIHELKKYQKNILSMRYNTEYFMDFKNSILKSYDVNAIVFSGIATDESFINMIIKKGINIIEKIKFQDHYVYEDQDIFFLKNKFSKNIVYITTEKDFVKLKKFSDFVSNYPVYYLKLQVKLNDEKNMLFNKLNELSK